jgi:hypothetical protein
MQHECILLSKSMMLCHEFLMFHEGLSRIWVATVVGLIRDEISWISLHKVLKECREVTKNLSRTSTPLLMMFWHETMFNRPQIQGKWWNFPWLKVVKDMWKFRTFCPPSAGPKCYTVTVSVLQGFSINGRKTVIHIRCYFTRQQAELRSNGQARLFKTMETRNTSN